MSDTLTNAQANILWGRAGGRCSNPTCTLRVSEYRTRRIGNTGERAHIRGKKEKAARHDPTQSATDRGSIDNHLLLCQPCHKMIDDAPEQFPVDLLLDWKSKHESRVTRLLDVGLRAFPTKLLRLNARFGPGEGRVITSSESDMLDATLARGRWIPDHSIITIAANSVRHDHEAAYWQNVEHEIRVQFDRQFGQIGGQASTDHLSVFASGPMPLLILLGKLLGDTRDLHVYEYHRREESWTWPDEQNQPLGVSFTPPRETTGSEAALVLGLSGLPSNDDLDRALGGRNLPAYVVTVPEPGVGLIRSPEHLTELRAVYHLALQLARQQIGHEGKLHVFPALGLSGAVAFGQALLPKIGPKITIYDRNQEAGGWIPTLSW